MLARSSYRTRAMQVRRPPGQRGYCVKIRTIAASLGLAVALGYGGSAVAAGTSPADEDGLVTATPQRTARGAAAAETGSAVEGSRSILADIHGEVGAMIGTGGAYAAFGTGMLPLGDKGSLTLSFGTGHEDVVPLYPAGPWDWALHGVPAR